jgi:hypothetical protein
VFLAELPQTFADGHDSLKSLVGAGWGNLAALDEVNWAWFSVPVLGSTSALAVLNLNPRTDRC